MRNRAVGRPFNFRQFRSAFAAFFNTSTAWLFALVGLDGTPWASLSRTALAMRVGPTGVLGYAPHNLLAYSADPASWPAATGTQIDMGVGSPIDGSVTRRTGASGAFGGWYKNFGTVAAGQTFRICAYVARVSGASNFWFGTDSNSRASASFNPSTGVFYSGPPVKGALAVPGGWLVYAEYTGDGAAISAVWYTQVAGDVFDAAMWITYGSQTLPYVPTTTTARYLPVIEYHPSQQADGSPYTVAESYGAELVTDPSFDTPGAWTASGASVSGGQATFADTTTNTQNIYQLLGLTGGRIYRVTLTGSGTVNVRTNTDDTASTYTLPVAFFVSKLAYPNGRLQMYNVSGSAAVVTAVSVKEYLGTVTTGTPARLGMREEAQATTLQTSRQFSDAVWLKNAVSAPDVAGAGPDGGAVSKLTFGSGFAQQFLYRTISGLTAGSTYTRTVYVKAVDSGVYYQWCAANGQISGDPRCNFNPATGAITAVDAGITASVEQGPVGYWILKMSFVPAGVGLTDYHFLNTSGTAARQAPATGDGTSGVYVWPSNLELGGRTSHISNPGTGTAVRAADDYYLSGTDLDNSFGTGAASGTVVIEFSKAALTSTSEALFFIGTSGGYVAGNLMLYTYANQVVFGNSTLSSVLAGVITAGSTNKVAISWDRVAGKISACVNGNAASEITGATINTPTRAAIGHVGTGGYPVGQAHIKSGRVVPSQYITGAALQALSA